MEKRMKQVEDTLRIKASNVDSEENMSRCLSLLKTGMEDVLNKNPLDDVDELHRSTFTMVLHGHGESIYNTMKDVITKHVESKVRDKVVKSPKSDLLDATIEAWKEHQMNMAQISNFVLYMDIHYAQSNGLDNLRTVGIKIFRDKVYVNIRDRVQSALLEMMEKEKKGDDVDHLTIKNTCQLLLTLGVNNRSVYEEGFERTFLQQLAALHKIESQTLLSKNDALVYIKGAEKILHEEENCPRNYFDASTQSAIIKVAEEELLTKPIKTIIEMKNSGVIYMLENEKTEDLDLMLRLFSRVPNGRQTIENCIAKYTEQKRLEEEKKKRAIEEEQKRLLEEQKRILEEQKRQKEEELKRQKEEEQKRILEEQKRQKEEEQKRAKEEEQKRMIEEQRRVREEKALLIEDKKAIIKENENAKVEKSKTVKLQSQNVKNVKCDETIIDDLKKIGKIDENLSNRRDSTPNKKSKNSFAKKQENKAAEDGKKKAAEGISLMDKLRLK